MSPIKITFIITGLSTGGAENMLLKLLEQLDRSKFTPHVISLTNMGEIGPRMLALGIPVEALGMRRGMISPIRFLLLVKKLRQIKPDIVHTWMYHADLMGGLAARLTRVPSVVWGVFSSDFFRIDRRLSIRFVLMLCKRLSPKLPDCVQYCSEHGKKTHAEYGYCERNSVVIPIGIDIKRFLPIKNARDEIRHELGIESNIPLLGLIGRFDPIKNYEGFIHAARFLHLRMPGVHFLIAGEGAEESNPVLKKIIDDASLADVFHLLGRRNDISQIIAALDLVSMTSWSEAFPTILVEAMACGVPCVSTDVGDASLILGDTGWIVPIGDMAGMADRWESLLRLTVEERKIYGQRARTRAIHRFELNAMVRRYEKMYVDVLSLRASSKTVNKTL